MFENGNKYKIKVTKPCHLDGIYMGDNFTLNVNDNNVDFLKPNRKKKIAFQHELNTVNVFLYKICKVKQVEKI